MVTQCNTGLKSTRSAKVDQVRVHLKGNFVLFLSGVPDFHLKPVLQCATTRYPMRCHKFYENFARNNALPRVSLDFTKNIVRFFIKSKITHGNVLFPAKFSYKLMVTRGVTLGNIMQHGLKIKICHARKKGHKIYFQRNPYLIYFG